MSMAGVALIIRFSISSRLALRYFRHSMCDLPCLPQPPWETLQGYSQYI